MVDRCHHCGKARVLLCESLLADQLAVPKLDEKVQV